MRKNELLHARARLQPHWRASAAYLAVHLRHGRHSAAPAASTRRVAALRDTMRGHRQRSSRGASPSSATASACRFPAGVHRDDASVLPVNTEGHAVRRAGGEEQRVKSEQHPFFLSLRHVCVRLSPGGGHSGGEGREWRAAFIGRVQVRNNGVSETCGARGQKICSCQPEGPEGTGSLHISVNKTRLHLYTRFTYSCFTVMTNRWSFHKAFRDPFLGSEEVFSWHNNIWLTTLSEKENKPQQTNKQDLGIEFTPHARNQIYEALEMTLKYSFKCIICGHKVVFFKTNQHFCAPSSVSRVYTISFCVQ